MADIKDFQTEHAKLRVGVFVAWMINTLILILTMEAAFLFIRIHKHTSTEQIVAIITQTLPVSAVLSVVLMLIVSFFSWRGVRANASKNMVEVQDGPIFNIVEEMIVASGAGRENMPKVYVAADVAEPNAFALSSPFGSMICFTDGIVQMLTREELKAVAAHEWGHVLSGDSKAMTKLIAMSSIVGVVSGIFSRMFTGEGNNNNNNTNPLAIVVKVASLIFLIIAPFLSQLSQLFMSRKRETQADIISVQLTRDPTSLAHALMKISNTPIRDKKFSKAVGQLAFFGSDALKTHPSTEKRLKALQGMGAQISLPED